MGMLHAIMQLQGHSHAPKLAALQTRQQKTLVLHHKLFKMLANFIDSILNLFLNADFDHLAGKMAKINSANPTQISFVGLTK